MSEHLRKYVNNSINILDFFKDLSIEYRIKGDEYFIVCPFHKDRNPSCSISVSKKLFHCFGCQKSGDFVFLLSKLLNRSVSHVVDICRVKYNVDLSNLPLQPQVSNDSFLKSLKRDELVDTYHCLCDLLIFSRRQMVKNPIFSDWMAFHYRVETQVELVSHNLRVLDEALA